MHRYHSDQLLTAKQLADELALPYKRIYELGIPQVRLSPRCIRWRYRDVLDWLSSRRITFNP